MTGPTTFVKGGTTRASHDQLVARQRADTHRRRKQYDTRVALANQPDSDEHGVARFFKTATLGSHKQHAVIVLEVRNKDNSVTTHIVCELSSQGDDLLLCAACPNCIINLNQPQGEAQILIRQSNRPFSLDTRLENEGGSRGKVWINPTDRNDTYMLAGEITTHGKIRCPNLGCDFRFVIDKNVMRRA